MAINPRLLNWGLFLVLLGAIPLAVRQGLLSADTVSRWWTLWPLLLVAAGIGLVLRRTSLEVLGGLLTAGTLGLMLGGLIAGGPNISGLACGTEAGTVAFPARDGTLQGSARVQLELNCGELQLNVAPGSAWRLEGSDGDGRGPSVEAAADRLAVRSNDGGRGIGPLARRDQWTVTLPADPTLDLTVQVNAGRSVARLAGSTLGRARFQVNAGELRADLAGTASLGRLDLELNAGTGRINLPDLSFSGRFGLNAGTLSFCVPDGAGLRVRTDGNVLATNNFDARGLIRSGNTWESPDFSGATVRIELEVNANAGTLNLNPTGGCNA
jgi:hypothetical protein